MDFEVKPGTQTVEYEPVGVKDLLVAMKDSSELIVDLAYSALLHNSDDLAQEVLELESKMDLLQLQARMNMLLAARKPQQARQLAPVLGIIGAAEKISEAAGDIASVVLEDTQLPGALRGALPEAMEIVARATVSPDSAYADQSLGEIDLETNTGVRVIALRKESDWELTPDETTRLTAGDVVLLRGDEDSIGTVFESVCKVPYEPPADESRALTDLSRAVDTIVSMKNVSELAVDLAYASVLFDDEQLAEEVHALEIQVDQLQGTLEAWTLQAAAQVHDPVSLRGLLHLASSTELISDAALEITEGILRDIDAHPVIAESVRESDIAVRRIQLSTESEFAGGPLSQLLSEHPGVSVIAVHRTDNDWEFYPGEQTQIDGEDLLIVRGTWTATQALLDTAGV